MFVKEISNFQQIKQALHVVSMSCMLKVPTSLEAEIIVEPQIPIFMCYVFIFKNKIFQQLQHLTIAVSVFDIID